MADELTASEVMRITDDTGVCPACGVTAERIEVQGGIALFWAHVPPCPAAIDPSIAVMSEVKPVDDELQEWERDFVEGRNERSTDMLDLVKFQWQNAHGYWTDSDWITVLHDDGEKQIRSRASNGRPGLQDIRIIDRIQIPESLRQTGRSGLYRSHVILYDDGRKLSGSEFIERMERAAAADES